MQGKNVFEANKDIIRDLKAAGVVVRHETYDHNYPHCWRTDQPLIYKAIPSWYVKVTAFRDRMVELNQDITWVPAHVSDGIFGNWLANARDWNIGRNRYLGRADPGVEVGQSGLSADRRLRLARRDRARFRRAAEGPAPPLCRRAGAAEPGRSDRQVDDAPRRGRARLLVRVGLDAVRPGALSVREQGLVRGPFPRRLHRRICRADARLVLHADGAGDGAVRQGAVPQLHLPRRRARREQAEALQAAEELSGPGRGLQHLRRRCAALVHGLLAAALRRRPRHAEGRHAPSARRCARCCCRSGTPIRSSRSTPTSTASGASWSRRREAELDRYILGKTAELVRAVEAAMDRLDIAGACNALPPFIEALNNWYIRRSRERFWKAEKDADKRAAYDTLYTVLVTLCRTMAPFLPYLTEHIHRALVERRERAPAGLAGCVGVRASTRRWSSAWTSRARSARRRPRSARRRTFATACRSAS